MKLQDLGTVMKVAAEMRSDVRDCQALAWVEPCEAARFGNRDEGVSRDEK